MPHHVYTTRGVVLALRPTREVDESVVVLTRDLGLIYASARGVRKTGSKLSSSLLDLSVIKVSLVRGKNAWRITTVTLLRNPSSELREKREALKSLARVASLLVRLVRGEEKHPELFDQFDESVLALLDGQDINVEDWEIATVANVLLGLGYLRQSDLDMNKKELVKAINNGLKESGLYNV